MELTSITRQIPYIQIPTTTVGTLKRLKLHLAAALIQISKNVSVNILAMHGYLTTYQTGPPLTRLEIQVGSGSNDGTSDWVVFKFRNGDGATCQTDYLNRQHSFATAGSLLSIGDSLGTCRSGSFRPDDELQLQIIVWRKGWNSWWVHGSILKR